MSELEALFAKVNEARKLLKDSEELSRCLQRRQIVPEGTHEALTLTLEGSINAARLITDGFMTEMRSAQKARNETDADRPW